MSSKGPRFPVPGRLWEEGLGGSVDGRTKSGDQADGEALRAGDQEGEGLAKRGTGHPRASGIGGWNKGRAGNGEPEVPGGLGAIPSEGAAGAFEVDARNEQVPGRSGR